MTPRLDLGLAELRGARRVDEVAGERELAAAAEREAVDRRDHRHRAAPRCASPSACAAARRSARACRGVMLGHRGDVGAGDERLVARAGQDHAAHVRRRAPSAPNAASSASQRRGVAARCSASGRLTVTVATAPSRVDRGRRSSSRRLAHARLLDAGRLRRRTRRSRARSCARASPRRRTGAAAGTAGTCRRRARGAAPRRSRAPVSRPIRSASASGPIGWLRPSLIAGVDVLGRAEALVQREAGLVEQRDQHAVDDEAGDVARRDRRLAEPLGERARRLVGRVAGRQAADDLDQLHQRHRVHEVHADHAIRAASTAPPSLVIEIDDVFDARIDAAAAGLVERARRSRA